MTARPGNICRVAIVAASISVSAVAAAGEAARGGAYARWDSREVTVGNAKFSATFRMRGGMLKTVSFSAR